MEAEAEVAQRRGAATVEVAGRSGRRGRRQRRGRRGRRGGERVRHPLVPLREPGEDERGERVDVEAEHVRLQQRQLE